MKINSKYKIAWAKVLLLPMVMVSVTASCSKVEPGSNVRPRPDADSNLIALKIDTLSPAIAMKHVGGLHTAADFTRIKAKLAANAEPWVSGYKKLTDNAHAQTSYTANPVAKLIRGGGSAEEPEPDNYSRAMNDVAAAYQLALRWKITGDNAYAAAAVQILNPYHPFARRSAVIPTRRLAQVFMATSLRWQRNC